MSGPWSGPHGSDSQHLALHLLRQGGGVNRPVLFCRAHTPICPRCDQPLPRLQLDFGSLFAICGYRNKGQRCGQRLHIKAVDGVCIVIGLTPDEYEHYTRRRKPIDRLYAELGIITPAA